MNISDIKVGSTYTIGISNHRYFEVKVTKIADEKDFKNYFMGEVPE